MIADLKPYAEYKESGLPWLGQVPGHWDVKKPRHIGSLTKGIGGTKEDAVLAGVPCVRYGELYTTHNFFVRKPKAFVHPERASRYTTLHYGDVLFAASGETLEEIGKSAVNLIEGTAVCGGDVIILRPSVPVHAPFLGYVMDCRTSASQKATMGRGTTVKHIYPDELKQLLFPFPPVTEQAAIVRLLDWATGRLERAIRAKRKVIALLGEQKQAIIHRAVTRGIPSTGSGQATSSVPLKPSGIAWLGDIPKHWEVSAIGAATMLIQTGPFGSQLHSHEYVTRGVPVINPSHMAGGRLRPSPAVTISDEKASELSRHMLCPGDIVIARRGELGRCALVTPFEEGWICGTGSLLLRCKTSTVSPAFFQVVFASRGIADMLRLSSIGATMANLNAGTVARQRLPLPPLDEQQRIVRFIEDETHKVEMAISRLEREIELLREYRTRLVADVVTGKLDVREAAARLPDEAPLDTVEDDTDLGDETGAVDEEASLA